MFLRFTIGLNPQPRSHLQKEAQAQFLTARHSSSTPNSVCVVPEPIPHAGVVCEGPKRSPSTGVANPPPPTLAPDEQAAQERLSVVSAIGLPASLC